MARPTKPIKRTERVTVRFTKAEHRIVAKFSERSGMRLAEYIHDKSLDHRLRNRLTDQEIEVYQQLVGVSNNLNQLTKLAHQRKLLTSEILSTLNQVNTVLETLMK